ncbi:MAG: MFS transporter [Candidatus Aenigmarchaeota archaeon]|nr:MFS transporter [Candidatus Aenigmarchaeota archaeon]
MDFLKDKGYQNIDKLTKKDLNNVIADGLSWQIFFTLTFGSVFLIGFALLLGATPVQIGLLSSIPFFANVAQIIGSYFIERRGRRKGIYLSAAIAGRLLWIAIIITPLFLLPVENSMWMIIFIFALSSILSSVSGVAWLSWVTTMVPRNILGKFFSKRIAYMSFLGVVAGLLAGFFVDYLGIVMSPLSAFLILFSIGTLLGMLSILFMSRVREFPIEGERVTFEKFKDLVKSPFKNPDFIKFVRFGVIWGFALGVAGPFIFVYQIKVLELGYMMIVALSTLFVVSGVIALGKWGYIVDKYGAKNVVAITALIVSLYPLFFIFITKENYLLLIPINILSGIAWSGVDFASAQILMRSAPQTNKSVYFSAFTAASGIAFAIGPIIGGLLANIFAGMSYSVMFFTFSGLHFLFIISGLLRLWSTSFIKDIHEPEAGEIEDVLSDMRTNRFMEVFANFYSVTRFSFGILNIPLAFGMRVVGRSGVIIGKGAIRIGSGTVKAFVEMDRLIRMATSELGKMGYKNRMNIIQRLNILNRKIKILETKASRVGDEKSLKEVQSEIVKVRTDTSTILNKLKTTPEPTKAPENYMQKVLNLVNRIAKR